jgi:CubicO group peptidase (beta-lactamase class C family)
MRNRLTTVELGMALIMLTASSYAADSEPPASSEVTAAMQPYLDQYKFAGVVGIIADRNGKVHYKNLMGYADIEARKPISEDNVFWIASMSKMFAGASIMMLVDEGKVSLGYHLRNGMFGHDGAYGTDLSVNPKTGMVAVFMVQCTSGDQWAARDLFLKAATQVFPK